MPQRKEVLTDRAPAPVGPYSQAAKIGNLVALAGQLGIDPATGKAVSDDVGAQVDQALRNMAKVLEAAGASMDDVIRVDVYLTDTKDFAPMNEVYAKHFTAPYPARTTLYVGLPATYKVEITALAVRPG